MQYFKELIENRKAGKFSIYSGMVKRPAYINKVRVKWENGDLSLRAHAETLDEADKLLEKEIWRLHMSISKIGWELYGE